jgi:hypothetical protein
MPTCGTGSRPPNGDRIGAEDTVAATDEQSTGLESVTRTLISTTRVTEQVDGTLLNVDAGSPTPFPPHRPRRARRAGRSGYTNRNPAAFQPWMPLSRALLLTNPSSIAFAA